MRLDTKKCTCCAERRCVGVYVGCYTQSELRGFVVVKRSSTINGVLLGYCLKLGEQKVFGAGKKNVILKVGLLFQSMFWEGRQSCHD